jgi:hypothetical protein
MQGETGPRGFPGLPGLPGPTGNSGISILFLNCPILKDLIFFLIYAFIRQKLLSYIPKSNLILFVLL